MNKCIKSIRKANNLPYYYIYISHLGGFYLTTEKINNKDLYCELCNASDYLIYEGKKIDILNSIREQIRFRIKMYRTSYDNNNECIKGVQFDLLIHELLLYSNIKKMFIRKEGVKRQNYIIRQYALN